MCPKKFGPKKRRKKEEKNDQKKRKKYSNTIFNYIPHQNKINVYFVT